MSHTLLQQFLGKSIVDNAKVHVGHVYNLDLKDFSKCGQIRVWGRLLVAPFSKYFRGKDKRLQI
jgi:sporulation protein YlmC with PRC-barrel domain